MSFLGGKVPKESKRTAKYSGTDSSFAIRSDELWRRASLAASEASVDLPIGVLMVGE